MTGTTCTGDLVQRNILNPAEVSGSQVGADFSRQLDLSVILRPAINRRRRPSGQQFIDNGL